MSGPRKRIRHRPAASGGGGGGGGGPTQTALLEVGPNFGENPKGVDADDTTVVTGLAHEGVSEVEFTNDQTTGVALDLASQEYTGDVSTGLAADLTELEFEGALGTGISMGDPAGTFPPRRASIIVENMHWRKSDSDFGGPTSFFGIINPAEDQPTQDRGVIARRSSNDYLSLGMSASPVQIRPETVDGVTEDERVAYIAWDLTGITVDALFRNFVIKWTLTNPSPVASATIDYSLRRTSTAPWTDGVGAISWNDIEPVTVGTQVSSGIDNVAANSTETEMVAISNSFWDPEGTWLYLRLSSRLAGTLITVEHANLSGQPNDPTQDEAPFIESVEWEPNQ